MSQFRPTQIVRAAVYLMLVLSAGVTLLFGGRLWAAAQAGSLPSWTPLLPACGFTAFVLVYAVDRYLLVKRRNFPAGRALFQVAFTVLFLTLLWPREAAHYKTVRQTTAQTDPVVRLLKYRDPNVRAAACELLGFRQQIEAQSSIAAMAEHDKVEMVKKSCQAALKRLTN